MVDRLVSLSVGIMLSTSLLHALPEAFESGADTRSLFICLLGGLLAFFLLEKAAILRHSHHHEGDGHHHEHGHDAHEAGKAGWMILVGNGMHNLTDGILIAAAFLANPQPFIDGTVQLTDTVADKVVQPVASEVAKNANWSIVLPLLALMCAGYWVVRSYLRQQLTARMSRS